LKILEFCRSDGVGGLELYAHQAIRELIRRGHEVTAVTAPGSMLDGRLERDGITRVHLARGRRWIPIHAARRLARLIDSKAIDVVHVHWRKDIDAAVWARWLARRRAAVIHTRQMQVTKRKRDPYHRIVYGSVDLWIAITDALTEALRDALTIPAGRITRLYYGVPAVEPAPAEVRAAFMAEHGIPKSGLRIGVFGRITRLKGQHLVVEALARLTHEHSLDATAVLVGHVTQEGYFEELRERAEQLGVADRVRYTGFVDTPSRLMNCVDVVVLPSYRETFGLVLVEAMRAGVAVIGASAGGVPEIIRGGETGLLFEPSDVDGLTAALARLARDPELRADLALRGKAFADETFDESRHFDALIELFTETVDRVQRRGSSIRSP
jgi:glycosyltransferase involved in cell wall biosynthesis